jgi:hypothetical protein
MRKLHSVGGPQHEPEAKAEKGMTPMAKNIKKLAQTLGVSSTCPESVTGPGG